MNDRAMIYIIYDGECPFCAAYVKLARLRAAAGKIELLDARRPHSMVDLIIDKGFDLDEGMAMIVGPQIYHGDSCLHQIAMMTGPSSFFNRLNFWVFKSPTRAKFVYPFLRLGRNFALRLMGRRKLNIKR